MYICSNSESVSMSPASAPTADAAPAAGPGDRPELPDLPSTWRRGRNVPDVYRGGNGSVGVQAQQIIGNVHAHAARHREAQAKMMNMRRHATIARVVAELCGLQRRCLERVHSQMQAQEWAYHQPLRGGGANKMWETNNV